MRFDEPSETITFEAHTGACRYCGGIVKMCRDPKTFRLLPSRCLCLQCGQPYHVVTDDLEAWERQQWDQKAARIRGDLAKTEQP